MLIRVRKMKNPRSINAFLHICIILNLIRRPPRARAKTIKASEVSILEIPPLESRVSMVLFPVWETKPVIIVLVIKEIFVLGACNHPRTMAKSEPNPSDGIAGTWKIARITRSRTGNNAHPEIQKPLASPFII